MLIGFGPQAHRFRWVLRPSALFRSCSIRINRSVKGKETINASEVWQLSSQLVSCQDTNPGPVVGASYHVTQIWLAGRFSKDDPWLGINPHDHANTVLCSTVGAPHFPNQPGVSGLALGSDSEDESDQYRRSKMYSITCARG